jgi:hypothetical protein
MTIDRGQQASGHGAIAPIRTRRLVRRATRQARRSMPSGVGRPGRFVHLSERLRRSVRGARPSARPASRAGGRGSPPARRGVISDRGVNGDRRLATLAFRASARPPRGRLRCLRPGIEPQAGLPVLGTSARALPRRRARRPARVARQAITQTSRRTGSFGVIEADERADRGDRLEECWDRSKGPPEAGTGVQRRRARARRSLEQAAEIRRWRA